VPTATTRLVVMSLLDREYQARRAMGLEEPLEAVA
jgi:hypothetical protein